MLDDTGLLDVVGQKHPLRRDVVRPKIICGASVAEIVRAMDLDTERFGLPVVRLIRGTEMSLVPISMWGKVRPKLGTRVEAAFPVRDPGSLALLASAALPSAATWAAGALGTAGIIGAAGTLSYALTVAAITVVGSLVINSLIPPAQQGGTRDPENYAITGTGNAINRRGVYPYVLGRHLMFPPMTATGFSETVGRDIYYRGRMTFGWGPVALEDLRIGSTPIWEYDGVELEFLNVDEARTLANMPQLADLVRPRTEEEHAPRKLLHAVGDLYEFQPAQAARSAVIAVEPTALRHGTVYSFVVEVAEAGVPGWTTVATYTDITTGQEFQCGRLFRWGRAPLARSDHQQAAAL
ncbi:hypothetical protein [Ponticoccus litoralis]|uniref:Phage tail protein n=1 Tax=Ponticoccus litoralis TaxID=422297 RepID=A0AAW9S570_9RHOB